MVRSSHLAAAFREQARERPGSPALVWRGREISYAGLQDLVLAARAAVDRAPAGPLCVVGEKSPQAVATILACLDAGRSFLIPPASIAPAALDRLVARAGCVDVLSPRDTVSDPATAAAVPTLAGHPAPALYDPERISFMLTTSGSTGLPKVVPLTTGAVDRFTGWVHERFDVGPGRTVLNYAPLNFDVCLLDVWATLRSGGRVVLVDPDQSTRASVLVDLIAGNGVHIIQAVPMLYELLLQAGPGIRLESVEHVLITGDAIRPASLAQLPGVFPNARFYNLYGCTETNDSFLYEIPSPAKPPIPLPLGSLLPGVRARLVGEDGTVLTDPGAGVGELYVSTPFQTAGYLGADLPEKFVPDPLGLDQRIYFRSGDLVRRDSIGRLTLVGRNDFQVKIRGQRVNTRDVERVLLEHEHVLEAVAIALPDEQTGHRLHGVVRRRPGSRLSGLQLRRHCAERLPTAAMPARLRITDEPLPATATGKIDRNLIRTAELKES